MVYEIDYYPGWDDHFKKMDYPIKVIIGKKIQQQKNETKTRHLHYGSVFYVVEVGQYRIGLMIDEKTNIKTIYFIGNHKQYEKWYKDFQ